MGDNECSLADEEEDVSQYLGSLTFSDEKQAGDRQPAENDSVHVPTLASSDIPKNPKGMSTNICFEVTDAKITNDKKSKFVMYTMLIKHSSSDLSPVSIERRYSDFEKLNADIRKTKPDCMMGVVFPKKQLLGNFKAQTIAERSRSFEQYMSHLSSIQQIHLSQPFKSFFYGETNEKAHISFTNNNYSTTVPLLRKVLQLQKKLYGDVYEGTVITLSALALCFMELGCDDKAQVCSEAAIRCLKNDQESGLLVPLLQTSIRLCWKLGKDKHDLERQLQQLNKETFETCNEQELKTLILQHWEV